jgi:hypothetical protein
MLGHVVLVAENERACKLLDCLVAYRKLTKAFDFEASTNKKDSSSIGPFSVPEGFRRSKCQIENLV